jgi:hypothetical protein
MIVLRSCGIGGGHHAGYASKSFGGTYYCPKHLRMFLEGFDPQPRDRVKPIDGPSWREYIVMARDGDSVSVKILGRPELEPETFSVRMLYPGDASHVFANRKVRGCGQ